MCSHMKKKTEKNDAVHRMKNGVMLQKEKVSIVIWF